MFLIQSVLIVILIGFLIFFHKEIPTIEKQINIYSLEKKTASLNIEKFNLQLCKILCGLTEIMLVILCLYIFNQYRYNIFILF